MALTTSKNGIELIKKWEGFYSTIYICPAGVPTIGYGHTGKKAKKGVTLTQAQAEELLKEDLRVFERHVNLFNKTYSWNQNEFDALVSFAFNVGNIKQLTNNGKRNRTEIATAMLKYNKGGGKVLKGLTNRRKDEIALFKTPTIAKSIKEVALDVIEGKYGNGVTRKLKLKAVGYNYEAVQKEVNKLLKGGK